MNKYGVLSLLERLFKGHVTGKEMVIFHLDCFVLNGSDEEERGFDDGQSNRLPYWQLDQKPQFRASTFQNASTSLLRDLPELW